MLQVELQLLRLGTSKIGAMLAHLPMWPMCSLVTCRSVDIWLTSTLMLAGSWMS